MLAELCWPEEVAVVVERPRLTARELEVLLLVCRGLTNKQIARALRCAPHTIEHHVSNILVKLDVASRTEAAVTAVRRRLI